MIHGIIKTIFITIAAIAAVGNILDLLHGRPVEFLDVSLISVGFWVLMDKMDETKKKDA